MKIKDEFSTSSTFDIFLIPFKGIVLEYELIKQRRKRDALTKSIIEIVGELSKEELFKKVDKRKLFEFLYSNINVLPYEITKDELYRRIRKVMVIEAMSKLFDGYPEELKLFEKRRKKILKKKTLKTAYNCAYTQFLIAN